jgi:hypothetical protein
MSVNFGGTNETMLNFFEDQYALLGKAFNTPFKPLSYDAFMAALKDPKNGFNSADQGAIAKIDQTKLKTALDAMSQGTLTQGDLVAKFGTFGLTGLDPLIVAPILTVCSGQAVLVNLPGGVQISHAGYPNIDPKSISSTDLANEVKRGRSYVRLPNGQWFDPPDSDILKTSQALLSGGEDPTKFFSALLSSMATCDASGITQLSDNGKLVLAKVIGVSHAEGDRYVETKETAHSWQKDLQDAIVLGAYWIPAGGQMKDFFGVGTNGSGIGESRQGRQQLGAKLCAAEKLLNSAPATALEQALGGANPKYSGNLLQQLVDYLNATDAATRGKIKANASAIVAAGTAYLVDLTKNAAKLKATVGITLPGASPSGA